MPTKRKATPKKTKRSAPIPSDKWFIPALYYGASTSAGVEVNEDTARRFSAVFACIKAISETLATIPLLTYRRLPNGGKERALDSRISRLLRHRPNRWQTSFIFRQFMFAHVLAWGNAYAEVRRTGAGEPEELIPLHPSIVSVKMSDDGVLFYAVRNPRTGTERVVLKRDMFHLLGPTDDGVSGYSVITAHREGIGLGLAAESFGASFFGNGATPAAVIEHPSDIAPEEVDQFKEKMEELFKGPRKAGKLGVLTGGMKIHAVGVPQKDAQYIELRRFQIEEVARIYRVPLYKLQDHTHSTFSNIEHLAIEWVTDCLLPWARRFEEAVLRDLYNPEADLDTFDDSQFAEFLFDGLLRGDTQSRYNAYKIGREGGWLSANDVRERENMNPIEDGDIYLQPMNMVKAGDDPEETEEEPTDGDRRPTETDEPDDGPADGQERNARGQEAEAVKAAFRPLFREVWGRVIRKEVGALKVAARKLSESDVPTWQGEYLDEIHDFARDCLREAVISYGQLVRACDPTQVLVRVSQEYREEVMNVVQAYVERPASAPARMVPELASFWTERLLSYPVEDYEQAA